MKVTKNSPNTEWLTAAELADYLKMSRKAIFAMVARREIPFSKLGKRRLRFSKAEIDAMLEENKVATCGRCIEESCTC
jgi:excisionase family DNA binding protein